MDLSRGTGDIRMGKASTVFESVEKSRLSSDIARQIEQAIREGRYVTGEALPSERQLTEVFKVSRPILREALRILEIQGFISIQQGRGSFVKDPNSDILNVPLRSWLNKNFKQVQEFYEARVTIEPMCAALTAERASDKQIQSLRELVEQSEPDINVANAAAYTPFDIDFHNTIARLSGNKYLYLMLKNLIVPETDVRKVILRLPLHIHTAHEGHMAILEAIEAREPELARQAMIRALQQPIKAIHKFMSEEEDN